MSPAPVEDTMRADDTGTGKTAGNGDVSMRVDHVGIAVESIEAAEPVLLAFGAEKFLEEPLEDFTWAYYRLGNGSRLELIEPGGTSGGETDGEDASSGGDGNGGSESEDRSFLTDFLDRYGPGLHHITLEVGDLDRAIDRIEGAGMEVVDRADGEDWRETFVSPRNPTGVLFQLMEYREGFAESREAGTELFVGGQALDGE
ncbi:glyoxalase [Halobacteriales archaeon QS_3_64_16]|nr:MAG: glyoxalase [Halobacteriales archaeon QS_3_64_16]